MKRTGRNAFREEANELLASLEDLLVELERVPDDLELVRKVFRDLRAAGHPHGEDLPAIIDRAWGVYDKVKNGEIRVIRKLIDLTLEARDSLRSIIDGRDREAPALRTALAGLKELTLEETERIPPSSHREAIRPPHGGPHNVSS